ncbi:MAG TPA: thioesterase family protein [Solirubrobacteraceae bacterium]|nr:thioesterase family protein [Solirubrobacteraceae bacterium]
MSEAFYEPLGGGRFGSTGHTAGPWDVRSQHAGPPAALLGRALEATDAREGTLLSRVTFEILGPVPVAEVEVESHVSRPGRTVELIEAQLSAGGRPVMTARAWRLPALDAPGRPPAEGAPLPRPGEETPPPHDFGYGHAVEMRFAAGGWFEHGPATAWTRLKVRVVPDEEPTPLQRVLAVADSGNGISAVMSWDEWLFINPELTVHVLRPPAGEWVVLDAATTIAPGGAAIARSVLSDESGPVAYGAQTLLVAPRPQA